MNSSARVDSWPQVIDGEAGARHRMTGKWTVVGEVWALTCEYVARVYLAFARRIWRRLPARLQRSGGAIAVGTRTQRLVHKYQPREQNHSTFFFRNRPELELLTHVLETYPHGAQLSLAILGCSKGAEVYSFAWAIRSERPDLQLCLSAVDISQEILDFAEAGVYSRRGQFESVDGDDERDGDAARAVVAGTNRDQSVSIFDRVTPEELDAMFEIAGDRAQVKHWLKQGIVWRRGDAGSAQFARRLGRQDIVVANRFLCHMKPAAAERCLRAIAQLVKPGGYLFVSGVDLDVRARVAHDSGWTPVTELLEPVHNGDRSLLEGWPLEYWSIEPFQAGHADRDVRYASVFKVSNS